MASKKLLSAAALVLLLQSVGIAQTDWGWDWKDTSKIAVKNLPQHNEFLNNQYPYPAQPRSQWELGFGAGPSFIFGEVKSKVGFGGTISLRKAFSHTFSYRINYTGLLNSGEPTVYGTSVGQYAYKSQTHSLGVDLIASLNSASHYRGNPNTNIYVLAGYSLVGHRVLYKKPVGPFAQPGGYNTYYGIGDPNSQNGLINTWFGANINGRQGWAIMHMATAGAGVAFKLNKQVNLGLEQKFYMAVPGYDYLDGYKGANSTKNDFISFTTARLNINIGNTSKRVEPLWWLNPNNYVYNELNSPKHMKMPPVVLPDSDGDGVTDQFDLEPNTPKGARVDTHGRAMDTDGDGVPDYRDKEPLTPLNCFPVNADGVGTCPEPACCKEIKDMMANMKAAKAECTIGGLPSIQFKGASAKLSKEAQALLADAAVKINANPNCKVKVIGYGASSKAAQQLSWERVNAVIKYLVEKQGVAESRFIFTYGQNGDANTVDLQGTTEEGPNSVPAPHPNLKSRK